MNITYIGNKLAARGGAPTSIDILAPLLQKEGFVVKTASGRKKKVIRMLHMLLTVYRNRKKTNFVLIDTYSTLNFWYAWAVALLCQRRNLKYIPILRGGDLPKRINKSPEESAAVFGHAYLNVVPSLYLKDALENAGYTNLKYIPNSIPVDSYKFRERESLKPKLLWVRAFAKIYNPMLAIKTLELLLPDYPAAELCMIGPRKDGSFEVCEEYVREHKLPVRFPGRLEKEEWIAEAAKYDIFLNTTDIDNTPVSLMEAMALGLPVVSTNVGGVPYLVDSGKTGILVTPGDAAAMTGAVKELLGSPEKAKKLSVAARKKIENFDWEVVKEEWIRLLSSEHEGSPNKENPERE